MKSIKFLVGEYENVDNYRKIKPLNPFDDIVIEFFNSLSKSLISNAIAKKYPDIITFAFFIRKSNVLLLKKRFFNESSIKIGLGNVFHIAPSNVPVNFAYSFFASFICGNANFIKVSNKEFEQVSIICDSIKKVLNDYSNLKSYISIFRYDNEKDINDLFSSICDMRIIWGGNDTINTIRESKIRERTREITFSDRYSFSVIDINYYHSLDSKYKNELINKFYNDTYLSDQNACSSPRLICFIGNDKVDDFYNRLYELVDKKYDFKDIFASNKYVFATSFAVGMNKYNSKLIRVNNSNKIYRILLDNSVVLNDKLIEYKGNCGIFFEVHYNNFNELIKLSELCNNNSLQTISYFGSNNMFDDLVSLKMKGIDRIVPIGKTMDFDLIWDGYDLPVLLTRTIMVE